jgi:polar amino acid transport system substrate-binding protein
MKLKRKKRWLAACSLALCLGLLVTGCGGSGGGGGGAPAAGSEQPSESAGGSQPAEGGANSGGTDSSAAEKVYVVGTDAAYPPFEQVEPDGKITGFDMDVIQAVADAAGFKIEKKHTGWDGVFDGIDKGTVDIGISTITITDDRKKKYDFSDPYFETNQLILLPEDSTVTKLADLKGKKIGVQSATTGEFVVQEAFGKSYEGLKGYDDLPGAVDDFFNKRLDAVVADDGVMIYYATKIAGKKYKTLKDDSFEPEYYGIMVKKGNQELLDKINQGIKTIKENGKLEELRKQYFEK